MSASGGHHAINGVVKKTGMMQVRKLKDISSEEKNAILNRGGGVSADVKKGVAEILEEVKKNGEKAVLNFTKKFDGVELESLEVSAEELTAVDERSDEFKFLRKATASIQKFHVAQLKHLKKEKKVLTRRGVKVWREWRPIEKVGIYAPGGLATYPSSVLMQAIPAKIAGCRDVILATPPDKNGNISPVVIAAAKISGVTKIIKTGGAQAIGALYYVYGVEKITGPGNSWVTEAKTQLSSKVAIDMPAGPSEILVLADETANPKFVAADLLSQAEHATDSSSILVTTSESLANEVATEVEKQTVNLSRKEIIKKSLSSYGNILITENLDSAIDFTNEYAPEHLEIITKDDDAVLTKIVNAGSIFLGSYSSEPAGDFATGSNHVLPTAGFAKNFSALSVDSFGKKIQVQKVTKKGLRDIQGICEKFGKAEGLDAHARSISIRFDE